MAGAKLLEERQTPTRTRSEPRSQRQHLPLHRLPQDLSTLFRVRRQWLRRDDNDSGTTRLHRRVCAAPRCAREGDRRRRAIPAIWSGRGCCTSRSSSRGGPTPASCRSRPTRRWPSPGVVAVLTAADVPYNRFGLIDARPAGALRRRVRFTGDKVAVVVAGRSPRADAGSQRRDGRVRGPAGGDRRLRWRWIRLRRWSTTTAAPMCCSGCRSARAMSPPGSPRPMSCSKRRSRPPGRSTPTSSPRPASPASTSRPGRRRDGRAMAARGPPPDRRDAASCPRTRWSSATPRSAGRSAGARTCRCSTCWPWRPGSCGARSAIVWSREESMVGHHKRHPMTIRCRWGATRDGTITAVEADDLPTAGPTPRPARR